LAEGEPLPGPAYRLGIFDFDGTLADSLPFFLSVFNSVADKHGLRRIEPGQVGRLRSMSTREIMRHVGLPAWKMPLVSASLVGLMSDNAASIALFDGVAGALRALADGGVALALVSSNSERNVRQVLGPQLGALFGHVECGMSVFGKAARIRKVLRQSGVAAADALYVGDQGTDAEAARKAGVAFAAVAWGYAPIEALRRHGPAAELHAVAMLPAAFFGPPVSA
jgi:phosphoglycolate phosphatase